MLFAVAVTRAIPLMRGAAGLLRQWQTLPPEQKALVNDEAADLIRSANVVKRALGSRLGAGLADDPAIPDWSSALEAALRPEPSFLMARTILDALRQYGPLDDEALAAAVGAPTAQDLTFRTAIAAATDDEHVTRLGTTWQLTALSDGDLEASARIERIEDAICATLERRGLAYRDALAEAVGAPAYSSREFQAALERALFFGRVVWSSPRVYALPPSRLEGFSMPKDLDAGTAVDLRTALAGLGAASARFGKALAAVRTMGVPSTPTSQYGVAATPQAPAPTSGAPRADVRTRLVHLDGLRADGVITEAEHTQRRAAILSEI